MDRHILHSYDVDLKKLSDLLKEMLSCASLNMNKLYLTINSNDKDHIDDVIFTCANVYDLDAEVVNLCIKIFSLRNPLANDLRFVFGSSHISRDLERISSNIKSIVKQYKYIEQIDNDIKNLFLGIIYLLSDMLRNVYHMINDIDDMLASHVQAQDNEIDMMYEKVTRVLLNKIHDHDDQYITDMKSYLFISRSLERIGDHIVNICVYIQFIKNGQFAFK